MGYKDFFPDRLFYLCIFTGKLQLECRTGNPGFIPRLCFSKGAILCLCFPDSKSGRVQLPLHRSALVISVSFIDNTGLIGYKAGWVPLIDHGFALLMTLLPSSPKCQSPWNIWTIQKQTFWLSTPGHVYWWRTPNPLATPNIYGGWVW